MDTRDWAERCFDGIGIRNPFDLRVDELPEQPNYFTCAFRRDKLEKQVYLKCLCQNRMRVLNMKQLLFCNQPAMIEAYSFL